MRRMVEAAQASALDRFELETERSRVDATVELAEEAEQAARGALALRTGIWSRAFRVEELPDFPDEIPTFEQLRDLMIRDHPDLARLRAAYAVAEKQLRLEVALQYPDLAIGGLFERDANINRFGLGVGIELPIFDRNQLAIAEARGRREQARIAFEAEVSRALARIEEVRNRLLLRKQRYEELRTMAEPATRKTIELGKRAMAAGAIDSMRYFALLRVNREVALELLDAQRDVYVAWSELEQACGSPLLQFPTEPVLEAPIEETES
jgi:outer membrane protein TolC